ncbi:HNH endonuclease [Geodermatophilus sp. TF02-6]|uniref:HNH endonuclease signature motif containing protein n=1 Tax=Geodermatophilus sp. TF02-6 TaxID=2250575 RepID=UPI000DE9B32E|nr:HNH endonuclease signature motif containing protein [Geodermatophilus sp. TF02-6]RBY82029.1 HNH endonuclease [Geodermatophilus sp. TF02-6]
MDDGAQAGTRQAPAPTVGWASGPLGAVQAADREIARQTALRARAVAAFVATRPASVDRAQGERGAMSAERWAARADVLRPVSEWATPELAIALNLTQPAAEQLLQRSLTLVHRLPATLVALETGVLHAGHLWHLIDKVAAVEDEVLRGEIEADLLAWAARRAQVTTPSQLGDKARRMVAQRDATAAARRLAQALKERGISIRPERADGMAAVTVVCTMPEAKALYAALVQCAEAIVNEPGEPVRTRGQKMVDALLDLVLRPGETDLPPVRVLLTIVASVATMLGGDAPGEVDGELVPAEMVRQLARAFAGLDPTPLVDVADDTTATDGEPVDVEGAPVERAAAELDAAEFDRWLAELVRRGFGDHPAPGNAADQPPWDTGPEPDLNDLDDLDGGDGRGPDSGPGACEARPPAAAVGGAAPPDEPATSSAGGWWAAADRAVDDAGAAVHAARMALGHARRSVRTAQQAEAGDEAAWRASPAGQVDAATDALGALAAAADTQREDLADLLTATAGGGLADRPRIVLADAVTGAMLALTELPGLRRVAHCGARPCRRHPETCTHDLTGRPGLHAAQATDGYRPGAALDRHGRARDRRCRFPGCRRRVPKAGELDHNRPYAAGGETRAANLAGYCTGDHRGKHQAPGWRHDLAPDGTLTVTTPTGLTAVTEPPPY